MLALLACATTGGLRSPFAFLLLGTLIVGAIVLTLRASTLLTVMVVAVTSGLEFWAHAHGPLPVLWNPPELPASLDFAIVALLGVAFAQLCLAWHAERAETEREQAVRLAMRGMRIEPMLGGLPHPVAIYDANGLLTYANAPYLALIDKPGAIAAGRSANELWPRRAAELIGGQFERARAGETVAFRLSFTNAENVKHEYDVFLVPNDDGHGKHAGAMMMMLDVTDAVRAKQGLIERESMYKTVIEHAPVGILSQVDGLLIYANPAALVMLSAEWTGRAVGRPFWDFIAEHDRDKARQRIEALALAPGFAEFKPYRLVSLDGQKRDVELAAVSVLRDGKVRVELFCVDVTAHRLADDRIRQLNETLEARVAERTAELEAFTSSVSHDLRAPARQVMSAADIMLRKVDAPGSDIKPMLGALHTTAERMNRTIDALLELSRLGRAGIEPAPLALNEMVEEIRAELSATLHGRAVTWRIGPMPRIHADPQLLRMVLVNLLDNAVKFTRYTQHATVEVWADQYADAVAVNVRDNGAGFDMRQAGKLFTMFNRLHSNRDFEGTGVGLAHCRRIVERHGGHIVAHGEPGKGATLRFTLPQQPPDE